jgi:peptidoglycan hydrolase CwlO-like protein
LKKEKQNLQKQIDNFNVLIFKDLLFIKDKRKEVNKNRREVKKLKYKLDEYVQKELFVSSTNFSFSSSSSSSLLSKEEFPQNWIEQ